MLQFFRSRVVPLILTISLCLSWNGVRADAPRDDIVVVGAGISGLCAALEAGRNGASVTVIDMASIFGGHAVMSSGMVCLVGTPEQEMTGVQDSPELAAKDSLTLGVDSDAGWAARYAKSSRGEVYDWLEELGSKDGNYFRSLFPEIACAGSMLLLAVEWGWSARSTGSACGMRMSGLFGTRRLAD